MASTINAVTSGGGGIAVGGDTSGVIGLQSNGTTFATGNQYGIGLGTAVPSSGIGITFPATQSASSDANTLDDYEEGTWTATPNANLTVTNNVGRYTKIGNTVTCSVWMGVSAVSSTNTVEFALPFTNATSPSSGSNITICPTATYSVATGDAGLIGYVDANYAGLTFLKIKNVNF
jgi:hypothetical protein